MGRPTVQTTTLTGPGGGPPIMPGAPSSAAQASDNVAYESDVRGRRVGVRRLAAIDLFDLSVLLGDLAENTTAMNQALVAYSVIELDGHQQPGRPTTMIELRNMIQRLDFDGFDAATKALKRFQKEDDAPKAAVENL